MDVGSELRDARERRRLSIDDLARRTKIKASTLSAIDRNDPAHLPGGIFTRAFVKQYAHEVGLDPVDIVERYEAQFAPEPAPEVSSPEQRFVVDAARSADDGGSDSLRLDELHRLVIAAVVVLVAASLVVFVRSHRHPGPASTAAVAAAVPRPVGSIARRADVPEAVATSGAVRAATPAAGARPGAAGLQVELRPQRACWIEATADGKRAAYRLLATGERVSLVASNELVLRVGDAASMNFSVNGARGRPLGAPAEAVTIRLTPANYRTFVDR